MDMRSVSLTLIIHGWSCITKRNNVH